MITRSQGVETGERGVPHAQPAPVPDRGAQHHHRHGAGRRQRHARQAPAHGHQRKVLARHRQGPYRVLPNFPSRQSILISIIISIESFLSDWSVK